MSNWLVYVIIAAVVIAVVVALLSVRARRRRQATTTTTMGLPDLGAVSGDATDARRLDESTTQRSHRPAS